MSRITELLDQNAESIIRYLPAKFNTHEFIWKFADEYEAEYAEMLLCAQTNEKARAFQRLHSQMGVYLATRTKELGIVKLNEKESDFNLAGRMGKSQTWGKK